MKKSTIKIISITIVILLILCAVLGVVGYYSDGFKNWDKFNPFNKKPPATEEMQSVGGSVLKPIISNGVAFDCKRLTTPINADSAYTLTAKFTANILENPTIIWSVKFSNLSSAWANGKEISDYLTLDKTITNSGEQVTVICKQDFGEQILITASAEADSTKKALCTVDYRKRIKSIDYKFKYDNQEIDNVTADEDGVYRVDYTNVNKAYSVVPIPIYSNYTIDENYSSIVNGKFTDIFGIGENVNLNDFTFAGGVFNFVEPELSENGEKYLDYINKVYNATSFSDFTRYNNSASNYYNNLSAEEKIHSKIINAKNAFDEGYKAVGTEDITISNYRNFIEKFNEIIDSYIAPVETCLFMNIDVKTFNNFLEKAYACNKANKGVVEYVIKYSSSDFVFEFKLSLGFTKSSLQSFTNIDLDTGEIII